MVPSRHSAQMIELLAGFQVSQAIYAAAKLGIADHLVDGPRPLADTAATVEADPVALGRLMRSLAGVGIFTEVEPGKFGLTPLGATLVTDEDGGSMRDLTMMWMETHYLPFAGLLDAIRAGETAATRFYNKPFFDWLSEDPEQAERFSRAMAGTTAGLKLGAVDCCDFDETRCVVDVGASDGALLGHLLSRWPRLRGVAFDLPEVVAARARGIERGLADRLRLVGGDFFRSVPEGGDTYLLSWILHDWDDHRAVQILTNVRAAAASGARVLALEFVVPPGDTPHISKTMDLTMLGMLTGRERTAAEFRALFEEAGLQYEYVASTATPMSLIHARVP